MCKCISHSPVPLNNEQRFKFTMSTYTWAASHCDQRWTFVFCETNEWNHRGAVKRTVNQHQNEPKQIDQPKPTNQATKEKQLT